jgi:glycosyltransferase involved in cell wall biosynthesis/putative flippase GtrA
MSAWMTRMLARPFIRFALLGGVFMAINLVLLHVLVHVLKVPYLGACVISFFSLNLLSYGANKVWTFKLEPRIRGAELLRFYGVMAVSLGVNLLLMFGLVGMVGMDVLVASVLVSVLLAVLNFLGHDRWTFWRGHTVPEPGALSILQVSAFYPAHGGGIEVVAGHLAESLASAGVQVRWMAGGDRAEAPKSTHPHLVIEQASSVDFLEKRLGLPMPVWGLSSLGALWRGVAAAQVVHVHDYLYFPSLVAICFAGMRGRPVVLTQHIGQIPLNSRLARTVLWVLNRSLGWLILCCVSQVVFVGQPVQAYFTSRGWFRRLPLLIPNGVDHRCYTAVTQRLSTDARLRLLFVGRFVEKKGLTLMRHCMDIVGCQWTFIGWGPLSPRLWADPLPEHVQVLEGLRGDAVVLHYQQADVLVLPSCGEGFPLVVQEALACGTPVLVSCEVGEAFPVTDDACVHQVELRCSDPVAALRQAIETLVNDREQLIAARSAAASLSRQWSWEACVQAYSRVYRDLLGQRD